MPFPSNGGWNPNGQVMPQYDNNVDESGIQVKLMGLKVHYSFDKENKVNCLARSSQTLQVQTVPLDDKNSIGIVDLRACLQAITECSPELSSQEGDYTIYALDYSEPDTPLVGQGMLSWALESMPGDGSSQPPKMVTGRVTRNVLAVFGGGNRETLEVKLRLAPSAKVQRPEPQPQPQPIMMEMQPMRPVETALTPTGISEWNSFMQSNPQIGHSAHVSRVASPALSQGVPPTLQRRDSIAIAPAPTQEVQRVAPVPVDTTTLPPQPSSRPSSRSSRKRKPTGRPRGRPRKKPNEGNTSGYEDGTEGEDGPATKRAKTTQVKKAAPNPFATGPESLRVAASTSGSIRNFRPVNTAENVPGNHLQEVPRAPTPVPEGGPMSLPPRGAPKGKARRESSMRQEYNPNLQGQSSQKPSRALSPSQEDGRSPESLAPTPNYSEDSPQDIGSSPPVSRTARFIQSSPPPSSPMLPPMPQRADASFANSEMDDLFDEVLLQPLKDDQFQPTPPVEDLRDATGIPTQVFQIKAGPDGADLVHIQNYNAPHPMATPLGPPLAEAPSLPPLINNPLQPCAQNPGPKRTQPSPPVLALTPPPTTDAIEKAVSPVPVHESSARAVTESAEVSRETSSSEPAPGLEVPSARSTSTQDSAQVKVPSYPPNPNPPRALSRSQSAGPLILPTAPANEPAGPSSLSQCTASEQVLPTTETHEIPAVLRRANSSGPMTWPVLASDPVGPPATLPALPIVAFSEAPCPHSDAFVPPESPKYNKNLVKKQTILQKLEDAISNGKMPPFCTNCGAINTPTWRKIWIQDRDGVPEYVEYSEKPGRITAIEILQRDADNKPLAYRLVKKSLGVTEDKSAWTEQLLCNPCGIWVAKYRSHRPADKWDNAFGRLGQERRKRGPNKKARSKSASQQPNPASEAYPVTDPLGPVAPSSPKQCEAGPSRATLGADLNQARGIMAPSAPTSSNLPNNGIPRSQPGSTHSRGSGTAESPVNIDFDEQVGSTRRLLFPSPRKNDTLPVLGEVDVNIVQTLEYRQNKEMAVEKENIAVDSQTGVSGEQDDLEALFRSPVPARPSTPPPKAKAATATTPFKTPTRPTPNHRPITRSVSRSLRSVRDILASPNAQRLLQRTPTKTPTTVRRSPRDHQANLQSVFDTPLSRTISQMLSDPTFDLGNNDLDLSSLPALDSTSNGFVDFGNILSTDNLVPSSPPRDGAAGFDFQSNTDLWAQWGIEHPMAQVKDNE